MKRVSQRSAESRGFSPGAPVSSHGESYRVGKDKHSQETNITMDLSPYN